MSYNRFCPSRKSDLRGAPIPQEHIDKGYYSAEDPYFYRIVGIENSYVYDGVICWQCPDCGHEWPRKGFEWAWEKRNATS